MRVKTNKVVKERLENQLYNNQHIEEQQDNKINLININIKKYNELHNEEDLEFINLMIERLKDEEKLKKALNKYGYIK